MLREVYVIQRLMIKASVSFSQRDSRIRHNACKDITNKRPKFLDVESGNYQIRASRNRKIQLIALSFICKIKGRHLQYA